MVTDEDLLKLQREMAEKYGQKVDVYHSEKGRTIGVFPHNSLPTPFDSLEVIRY